MGLAPIVTMVVPLRVVIVPVKSLKSASYCDGMVNCVEPQAGSVQGKDVKVLSQTIKPWYAFGPTIGHCQIPDGGTAAQLPPLGLVEQVQAEAKVFPSVQVPICL